MPLHRVDYRATQRFTPIVVDYVEGEEGLREFYTHIPDRPGLQAAINARRFDPDMRATLCAVLEQQYDGTDIDPAVRANLDALRQEQTLTVTTGHQLCLFTGPLYVPFKILNIIRLARELSTPAKPVVPVFWMATEDHDRAEIDHAWLGDRKVQWPGDAAGPVGRLPLAGIDAVLKEVDVLLGFGPHADELRAILRACYRKGSTLAQATRLFVNALFGRFGLVIIDADDKRLKSAFAPVMQEELLNQITIRTVRYANDKLVGHYEPQAHAREINLFHISASKRSRIDLVDDHFQVLDGGPTFTAERILVELQLHPELFSPNVLLRPVYQETVLPNVAYIGGGGELAYWLQLRWLFQGLQVPMPALVLRTSALFLHHRQAEKWRASGLRVEDLFATRDVLEKRIAVEHASFSTSLERERAVHAELFNGLAQRARNADPTLEASVRAKEAFSAKGLDMIERRLVHAAKRQQADRLRRMNDVLDGLFAHGLQERRENFMPYYAREGPAFFDRLLVALDPLEPRFSVLEEQDAARPS
ncbi:MAG: bacillithiol biosynthesis cysteine-adding enzyme BshC [Flavobacteriales bacterium]|nr:bacillithiol biosynthesis cysteine-adding enzyme BshC [Flavobacteriales bacterium]